MNRLSHQTKLESIYESYKLHLIIMKIKERKIKIPSSEITSESNYLNRRKLIQSVDYFHWVSDSVNQLWDKINQ